MSEEPYTLTVEQIDALHSMPPGIYFVCATCRKFKPAPVTVTFRGMGEMVCEACA
jgi:hypothetical protein